MRLLEQLAYIHDLAASNRLDELLAELGVPDFDESIPVQEPRKFGSRPTFDRSSFDIEAYTAEIERHFKK
jgi:hypothetical protein